MEARKFGHSRLIPRYDEMTKENSLKQSRQQIKLTDLTVDRCRLGSEKLFRVRRLPLPIGTYGSLIRVLLMHGLVPLDGCGVGRLLFRLNEGPH